MGQRAAVHDDGGRPVAGAVNGRDEFPFRVGLQVLETTAEPVGGGRRPLVHARGAFRGRRPPARVRRRAAGSAPTDNKIGEFAATEILPVAQDGHGRRITP